MKTGIKYYTKDAAVQMAITQICDAHGIKWEKGEDAKNTSFDAHWFTSTTDGVAWSQKHSYNFRVCPTTVSFDTLIESIKGASQIHHRQQQDRRRINRLLGPLLATGTQISNVAYNSKQRDDVPADIREHSANLQKEWDRALARLPKWMRRRIANGPRRK